jgi:hypothetical protein
MTDRLEAWLIYREVNVALAYELATYFTICAVFGLVKGLAMGQQLARMVAW